MSTTTVDLESVRDKAAEILLRRDEEMRSLVRTLSDDALVELEQSRPKDTLGRELAAFAIVERAWRALKAERGISA